MRKHSISQLFWPPLWPTSQRSPTPGLDHLEHQRLQLIQRHCGANTVLTFPLQVDCLLGQFVLLDLVCADDDSDGLLTTPAHVCLFRVDKLENICADKCKESEKYKIQKNIFAANG